jgi:hypothetical protein
MTLPILGAAEGFTEEQASEPAIALGTTTHTIAPYTRHSTLHSTSHNTQHRTQHTADSTLHSTEHSTAQQHVTQHNTPSALFAHDTQQCTPLDTQTQHTVHPTPSTSSI